MPRFHPKRRGGSAALLAAIFLAAGTVHAAPVFKDIRFDQATGLGMTEATAMAAFDSGSGIQIVSLVGSFHHPDQLGFIEDVDESSAVVPGPPATATSTWNVTNQMDELLNDLYLVFAKPIENTITVNGQPQEVNYVPSDVGLTLQNGLAGHHDWVILKVPFGEELYYYPAVSLGTLGVDQTTDPFLVNYILDNPQIFIDSNGFELGLPRWQVRAAFVPIPEPSPLLLIAVGIGLLAVGRRRRS